MWILKRLVEMGVPKDEMVLTFHSRIRTHLEQNIPMWHFSISKKLSKLIEKVQKACAFIILGKHATPDYSRNLAILGLEPLDERRMQLCKSFAKKTLKHPVHSKMFTFSGRSGARSKQKVIVPYAKTKQYETSSGPSLS